MIPDLKLARGFLEKKLLLRVVQLQYTVIYEETVKIHALVAIPLISKAKHCIRFIDLSAKFQ